MPRRARSSRKTDGNPLGHDTSDWIQARLDSATKAYEVTFTVFSLDGIPEIISGDDLAQLIGYAVEASGGAIGGSLRDGGILWVRSKVVSKAEREWIDIFSRDVQSKLTR